MGVSTSLQLVTWILPGVIVRSETVAAIGRSVSSGDLIEVEMVIDSKNDYEYLMLEDHKTSGFEPDDQRNG